MYQFCLCRFFSSLNLHLSNFIVKFCSNSVHLHLLSIEIANFPTFISHNILCILKLLFDHTQIISERVHAVRFRSGDQKAPMLLLNRFLRDFELILQQKHLLGCFLLSRYLLP